MSVYERSAEIRMNVLLITKRFGVRIIIMRQRKHIIIGYRNQGLRVINEKKKRHTISLLYIVVLKYIYFYY